MNKLWSFFWLVVAACVAATILLSWLAPYMWIIITLLFVGSSAFIIYKIYAVLSARRRHF